MAPRLLLISYHFGPHAATGAVRWNVMADYLCRRGWVLDVIARSGSATDGQDGNDGMSCTGQGAVRVHRIRQPVWLDRTLETAATLKHGARNALRHLVSRAPETPVDAATPAVAGAAGRGSRIGESVNAVRYWYAELAWAGRAARFARRLAARERYDAVVVSSPPHPTQVAGERVARALAIPLIADFRDPWIFGRPDRRGFGTVNSWLGQRYERRTLRRARLVICNTPRAAAAVNAMNALRAPALSIPNGYDRLDCVSGPDQQKFRIVFSGGLYESMDPGPLFAACARLIKRHDLTDILSLEFMGTEGTFRGVPLGTLARNAGLSGNFILHPRSGREAARKLQQAAAVNVIFDNPPDWLAVPTKFYDALQLRGHVMVIGNAGRPGTALTDCAAQIGLTVLDPADASSLDAGLESAFRRWTARDFQSSHDPSGVFDRVRQSERMHETLHAVLTT